MGGPNDDENESGEEFDATLTSIVLEGKKKLHEV